MADLTKTIEIIFGGKDDTSRTIKSIEGGIDDLAGKIGTATQPLADLTKGVLAVDAALAALVVGGMAYAIKTAGEFSGQFGEITTLIADTGEPIDRFKQNIIDYSTESVKSIDQINQAVYSAISAGVDYKDSLGFVSEAEKLSVAGRADLGETTKALISVVNAYGASADQAGKYSDIMFTTVRLGQTTIEELSSSLSKVTGIAANTGVPFETLSAAIAALTVAGAPTSEAITGIKAALTNIINPTKEAQEMADSLGLQFNATALKTKGFEGVLNDVYKATGGSTEQMAKLFGSTEALNAVFVLSADKTGKFKDALSEMSNAAGSTQIAYDKVANEFENINQRLANNFQATIISIGQEMLPEYGKIATALSDVFKGIKVGVDSGAFDPLFDFLGATGTSIADWLNKVAAALPEALEKLDFDKLIASFKSLGTSLKTAFEAIFGDIDLTTSEGLSKAIQKVIDSVAALQNVVAGIITSFGPFLSAISAGIDKFSDADASTQDLVGTFMGFATQLNMVVDNIGILTGALEVLAVASSVNAAVGLGNLFSSTTRLGPAIYDLGQGVMKLSTGILGKAGLAFAIGYAGGTLLNQFDSVKLAGETWAKWSDQIFNWTGTQTKANVVTAEMSERIARGNENLARMRDVVDEATAGVDKYGSSLGAIPETKNTELTVSASGKDADMVKMLLTNDYRLDPLIQSITVNPGLVEFEGAQAKIDEIIPKKKEVDIQAKLDVEKLKAQADIIQTAIEWKAKLDIAEVEAATKQIEAAFESINNTISTAGSSINDLFKTLASEDIQGSKRWAIEDAIKNQTKLQQDAAEQQKELTDAQIKYMRERTAQMARGDAMITIDGAGLQPHLEAFMFEILSAIQIRANEEGAKFLVGI